MLVQSRCKYLQSTKCMWQSLGLFMYNGVYWISLSCISYSVVIVYSSNGSCSSCCRCVQQQCSSVSYMYTPYRPLYCHTWVQFMYIYHCNLCMQCIPLYVHHICQLSANGLCIVYAHLMCIICLLYTSKEKGKYVMYLLMFSVNIYLICLIHILYTYSDMYICCIHDVYMYTPYHIYNIDMAK